MRVLLIQQKYFIPQNRLMTTITQEYRKLRCQSFPLGLSYVASALKDHQVTLFDQNIMENPFGSLMETVKDMEPEVVGLSLRNLYPDNVMLMESFREIIELVRRKTSNEVKFVMGGPSFSLYPRKIMEGLPEIDYGVLYEGEESMPELLDNIDTPEATKGIFYREGNDVLFTGERDKIDFDGSRPPSRHLVDLTMYAPYAMGVQTKRGCTLKCKYCCYPLIEGTALRLRSPKRVVDEIEDLVRSHDVRTITFVDNVFNNPPHHAEEICQEIIERKLDIHWSAWLNEEHITREFMKLAREAGCTRIGLSPDGFSDRSLKMLGKPMTKKNIVDTYNVMKKIDGIKIRYNFFYWPPGQDLITFLKLLWFNIKARWTLRGKLEVFNLGNIALYDNTQLHKEALRKGIISEDVDLFFSVFRYPVPKLLDLFEKVYKSSIFMKRLVRKRSKKWFMPDDLSQY